MSLMPAQGGCNRKQKPPPAQKKVLDKLISEFRRAEVIKSQQYASFQDALSCPVANTHLLYVLAHRSYWEGTREPVVWMAASGQRTWRTCSAWPTSTWMLAPVMFFSMSAAVCASKKSECSREVLKSHEVSCSIRCRNTLALSPLYRQLNVCFLSCTDSVRYRDSCEWGCPVCINMIVCVHVLM